MGAKFHKTDFNLSFINHIFLEIILCLKLGGYFSSNLLSAALKDNFVWYLYKKICSELISEDKLYIGNMKSSYISLHCTVKFINWSTNFLSISTYQ